MFWGTSARPRERKGRYKEGQGYSWVGCAESPLCRALWYHGGGERRQLLCVMRKYKLCAQWWEAGSYLWRPWLKCWVMMSSSCRWWPWIYRRDSRRLIEDNGPWPKDHIDDLQDLRLRAFKWLIEWFFHASEKGGEFDFCRTLVTS